MRSTALRLWAELLERFPEDLDFSSFWDPWFCAVEPLMERLTVEVGGGIFGCHHDAGSAVLPD